MTAKTVTILLAASPRVGPVPHLPPRSLVVEGKKDPNSHEPALFLVLVAPAIDDTSEPAVEADDSVRSKN